MHAYSSLVAPAQLDFTFRPTGRGGARPGAGRPKKQGRASSPHKERPELAARHPVHVTLRTVASIGNLRRKHAYHAIRWAMYCTIRRDDFRIVHVSLQRD